MAKDRMYIQVYYNNVGCFTLSVSTQAILDDVLLFLEGMIEQRIAPDKINIRINHMFDNLDTPLLPGDVITIIGDKISQ